MTNVANVKLTEVTTNTFGLSFPDNLADQVRVNLLIPPEFKTNIPGRRAPSGLLMFDPEQLRGKTLIVDTTLPSESWSFGVTLCGLLASVAFFAYVAKSSQKTAQVGKRTR